MVRLFVKDRVMLMKKFIKRLPIFMGVTSMLFHIVYMLSSIIGDKLYYIFYIFRPELAILIALCSLVFSAILPIIIVVSFVKTGFSKKTGIYILTLILHLNYLRYFYCVLLLSV